MADKPDAPTRAFISPLVGDDLLDPGQVFPASELLQRVLSTFWSNCCRGPGRAKAPAPILEFSRESADETRRSPRRAWWVLSDAIVEDHDGLEGERLGLFFSRSGRPQLWPSYDFEFTERPLSVQMNFHRHAALHWSSRIGLEILPNGMLHVIRRRAAGND